jgi:hypothetical protein
VSGAALVVPELELEHAAADRVTPMATANNDGRAIDAMEMLRMKRPYVARRESPMRFIVAREACFYGRS